MNTRVFLCAFLLVLIMPLYPLRETSYIGKIIFNKEISEELDMACDNFFPVYFKGGIFYGSLKTNTIKFEISGSPHVNALYLLITDCPPLPQTLEEENLRLPTKARYKFYKLIRKIRVVENGYEYFWKVMQAELKHNLVLPDSTIIVLADPNTIQRVESSPWKEGMLVLLPTIYMDDRMSRTKINELIMHAHFSLMDLKNCHRQDRPLKICKDNCVLSMPKNILS